MRRIKSDRILAPEGFIDGYIYYDGGKIIAVTRGELVEHEFSLEETHDFTGKIVSPGFIEMHTHGAGGFGFVDCTMDDVLKGVDFHLSRGVTTILPTVSAAPIAKMREALAAIDAAKKSGKSKAYIHGAHLEGPYLSEKQAGAQCPDFITKPKASEYWRLLTDYQGSIARWTYAPEQDSDLEFTHSLTLNSVVASAGHTDATGEEMLPAVDAGCRLVTHLYSCTSTITRDHGFRHLGVIETAFLRDDVTVEIIADGKHLPPDLIRMIIKIKGIDRVAVVTDSLHIAGTDIKEGVMSGTPFIVEEGVCRLADRSAFAGSVATADRLIRVLTQDVELPLHDAVHMMTVVPARILGLRKGRIATGYDADFAVFDDAINVSNVFVGGKLVK